MKASFVALALSAISAVTAAPLAKRQMPDIDATILQYALTLEHLESTFYYDALNKFDAKAFTDAGIDASVRGRVAEIGQHEKAHVAFLQAGLTAAGVTPTERCQYSFPYTDPKSFLAVAAVLEGVGVSAYLGAAANITSPAYLTAAASIYGIEARHASYIRNQAGSDPFPAAFEIPLGFSEVYSLAAQFITSCPSTNPTLPVKAFPTLTAAPQGSSTPGGMVKLTPGKNATLSGPLYAAFVSYPGSTQYGAWNYDTMTVTIPESAIGQTYVALVNSMGPVTDETIVAGVAAFEVVSA